MPKSENEPGYRCGLTHRKAQAIVSRVKMRGVFINNFSATNTRILVGSVNNTRDSGGLSHFRLHELANAQAAWVKTVS